MGEHDDFHHVSSQPSDEFYGVTTLAGSIVCLEQERLVIFTLCAYIPIFV